MTPSSVFHLTRINSKAIHAISTIPEITQTPKKNGSGNNIYSSDSNIFQMKYMALLKQLYENYE